MRMHHYWLKTDEDYAEAFEEAKTMAAEVLEDEASRRAMGFDEQRYTKDGTPYTIRKYSDTLLIVRLKAVKPEVYKEVSEHRHSGTVTLQETLLEQARARKEELRHVNGQRAP